MIVWSPPLDELVDICEIIECPDDDKGGANGAKGRKGNDLAGGIESGLSVFLPFSESQLEVPLGTRFFGEGEWLIRLGDANGNVFTVADFDELPVEFGSGVVGDEPGEGVNLYFDLPQEVLALFENQSFELQIHNLTGGTQREDVYQVTVARGNVPDIRPTSQPFSRGDSSNDGLFDITDAITTLGFLFFGNADIACEKAADVDGSSAIDLTDPINSLRFLLLGGVAPRAPFPGCGTNESSTLSCESYAGCR